MAEPRSTPHAACDFEGLSVMVMRSLGSDRALVVHIDGPEADADRTDDGRPAIRVWLDGVRIYNGRPYVDPEE